MPAIPAIAMAIKRASGWRRWIIAFAAGAVGALAMAPFNFFPALMIPMTVAIWLIDGEAQGAGRIEISIPAARRAFADGWWWGFGYFVASFWWLGAAFLVEADEFAWAMPLGVAGLPAMLAVFPAFRVPAGAAAVVARRGAAVRLCRRSKLYRMAARTCLDGISLE